MTSEQTTRAATARKIEWILTLREAGVGAIDSKGHAIVALAGGRYVVTLSEGDAEARALLATDTQVDPNATDLSIIPPYAMILYGGGDAGYLAAQRGAAAGYTTTRLDARRPDGTLAWRVTAPFLATQPAIDGDGRVYLVGPGIAAYDMDGRSLWSARSPLPLRATAFADGTLAVVRGSEVQIVANDGTIKQSFRAEEELTSYPAIDADGAIWVASAKTLYVVR